MNINSNYSFPIYEQNDLLYSLKFETPQHNTICNFGFENTGSSNKLNFFVSGGQIYDEESMPFFTIEKNNEIYIYGNIKPNSYSFYSKQNVLGLEKNKQNFNINNFYLNTSHEIKNFSFSIDGKTSPIIGASILNNPYATGEHVTGIIINSGEKSIILKDITVTSYYDLTGQILNNNIGPNQTGKFLILTSGLKLQKNPEVSVNLYGNFGVKNHKEIIFSIEKNELIFEIEPYKIYENESDIFNENSYEKYKIFVNRKNINSYENVKKHKNIKINFEYFSGYTGDLLIDSIPGTGLNKIEFNGMITGSGVLTKNQNIFLTGYDFISEKFVSGYSSSSKDYTSQIYYLNGTTNQLLEVTGSGFITGGYENKNNNFIVTGETRIENFSGYIQGYDIIFNTGINFVGIGDDGFGNLQSGYIKNHEVSTGSYFVGYSNANINNILATGVVRGLGKNVIFNHTGYASGIVSGYITGSGYLKSNNVNYLATGRIIGDLSNAIVIKNVNREIYSSLSFITGNLNHELKDIGTGLATGDYTNTNITGNINLATGIKPFIATGIINGSGVLYGIGQGILRNKYGEEEFVVYTGAKMFYANGNPNNLNDPINIYTYAYNITGTGLGVYRLQDNLNYKINPNDNFYSSQIFTGTLNENFVFTGSSSYPNNIDINLPNKISLRESGNNFSIIEQDMVRYFNSSNQTNLIFSGYKYSGYVTGKASVNRPFIDEKNYYTGINYNVSLPTVRATGWIYSETVGNYAQLTGVEMENSYYVPVQPPPYPDFVAKGAGESVEISSDGKMKVIGWPRFRGSPPSAQHSLPAVGLVIAIPNDQISNRVILTGQADSLFGHCLSINHQANILAVGAPKENVYNKTGCGAVYIYTGKCDNFDDCWSTYTVNNPGPYWKYSRKINIPEEDAKNYVNFGLSIDMNASGNYLVVGCPNCYKNNISGVGAAYVFSKDGNNDYNLVNKIEYPTTGDLFNGNPNLTSYSPPFNNKFGAAVSIGGFNNLNEINNGYFDIYIGSPNDAYINATEYGSFYRFVRSSNENFWQPSEKIRIANISSGPILWQNNIQNAANAAPKNGSPISIDVDKTESKNIIISYKEGWKIYNKVGDSYQLSKSSDDFTSEILLNFNDYSYRESEGIFNKGYGCAINSIGDTACIGGKSPSNMKGKINIFKKNLTTSENSTNVAWNLLTGLQASHYVTGFGSGYYQGHNFSKNIGNGTDDFGASLSINSEGNKFFVGAPFGSFGGFYTMGIKPDIIKVTGNFNQNVDSLIYNNLDLGVFNFNYFECGSGVSDDLPAYPNENLTTITGKVRNLIWGISGFHDSSRLPPWGHRISMTGNYNLTDIKVMNSSDSSKFELIKNSYPKISSFRGSYPNLKVKGTGFMIRNTNSFEYSANATDISGNLPVYGRQEGSITLSLTGYTKNINEVVYGNLQDPISIYTRTSLSSDQNNSIQSSGVLNQTIFRTGYFQEILEDKVTGSFYSQKEFIYTGELTKNINVDITNPLGYIETGIYLNKNKNLINLNNFNYNGNIIDLTPITDLEKSGLYTIYATGYKEELATGIVRNSILTDQSGTFICTGLVSQNKNYLYTELDIGKRSITDSISGFFDNPKILNNSGYVEGQYIGTGSFNDSFVGSGLVIKAFETTPISYIQSGERLTGVHIDYKILNKQVDLNVVSGVINYNNNITGLINGFNYTGYYSTGIAKKIVNFEEFILETGIISNPNVYYQRKFLNFFNIKTGYYLNENVTGIKNFKESNSIVNETYIDEANLDPNIDFIYLEINKTKDYSSLPLVGKLTISGDSEGITKNLHTYISGKGGLS